MVQSVLSIQSAVAYGHVGNSAAAFPLQRMGFEVWPVNTVLFSNHTGYGLWKGRVVDLDWVREIIDGVEERGAFPGVAAVMSGYLGAAELGLAVLDAVARVRRANPKALYACDPVMGDEGRGFFVREGIPEFFRAHAVPSADIITPNHFELAYLAAMEIATLEGALEAAAKVRAGGPSIVACTSLEIASNPGELGVLVDCDKGSWIVWKKKLPVTLNGTGDAFTSLFVGAWLKSHDPAAALQHAASAMFDMIEKTHAAGSRELLLIEAQDAFVDPPHPFKVVQIR